MPGVVEAQESDCLGKVIGLDRVYLRGVVELADVTVSVIFERL